MRITRKRRDFEQDYGTFSEREAGEMVAEIKAPKDFAFNQTEKTLKRKILDIGLQGANPMLVLLSSITLN